MARYCFAVNVVVEKHAKVRGSLGHLVTLSIEIAVSTMELQDAAALVARMGLAQADVDVLIINQVDSTPPPPVQQGRLRVYSFQERGLSRSRNHALDLARRDIMVIADDDLEYQPGFETSVRAAFAAAPGAAILTFQFLDSDTNELAKKYSVRGHAHHRFSVPALTSMELAIRRSLLPRVHFDERFGLGAQYPSGEEAIFVADAMRAGAKAQYVPLVLCSHPGATTGHRSWGHGAATGKGAIVRRLFPRAWPLVLPAFVTAKLPLRDRQVPLVPWLIDFLQGALELDR